MKTLRKLIPAAVGALCLVTAAQATTIDFSTVATGTTDPVIGDVKFWAGNPSVPNDTYVDDFLSPLNNYLTSGHADGYGDSPASGYDYFIGMSRVSTTLFGTVSVDIAADFDLPCAVELKMEAFLGASLVGSTSTTTGCSDPTAYHSLTLTLAGGADTLYFSNPLNIFDVSDTSFRIDNVDFSDYVPVCTGPNCNNLPEPASLLLVGVGLAGLALGRRRFV